jgi:hypothetical protein
MNQGKKILAALFIAALLNFAAGCAAKTATYPANQINPVDQASTQAVRISQNPSYQEEFTDSDLIGQLIANLQHVQVRKLSPAEEVKILDNGSVMKKDSTITLELLKAQGGLAQSFAVLLSPTELLLSDVKTMASSERTVSYLSAGDETTLQAVQKIYGLLKEATAPSSLLLPASVETIAASDDSAAAAYWHPKDLQAVRTEIAAWLKAAVPYTEKVQPSADAVFHANIGPSRLQVTISAKQQLAIYPAWYVQKDEGKTPDDARFVVRFVPDVIAVERGGSIDYYTSQPLYNWLKSDQWQAEFTRG